MVIQGSTKCHGLQHINSFLLCHIHSTFHNIFPNVNEDNKINVTETMVELTYLYWKEYEK